MSMAATVTATTTHQVKLAPTVKAKMQKALKVYGELKAQRDALDEAIKKQRGLVEDALAATGEEKLDIAGFKVSLVAPIRKRLDEKKLIAQGVTTDQIAAATIEVPTAPYVKITVPGQKGDE